MSLRKLLAREILPVGFMDEKLLLVPTVSLGETFHARLSSCSSTINYRQKELRTFVKEMGADYESSRSNFEVMSLNDLLEREDDFCEECLTSTLINLPVNFVQNVHSLRMGEAYLSVAELIRVVSFYTNRLTDFASADVLHDLSFLFPQREATAIIFETVPCLKELKEDVRNRIFTDRVPSLKIFHEELSVFIMSSFFSKGTFTEDGVVDKVFSSFENTLKKELLSNTDMVIFDAVSLKQKHTQVFAKVPEHAILFEKILFSPGFNASKFAVLPYVEFEVLKIIVNLFNVDFYMQSSKIILDNHVVISNNSDLTTVVSTMEKLFDESNEVMSDYASLYEIAVNV